MRKTFSHPALMNMIRLSERMTYFAGVKCRWCLLFATIGLVWLMTSHHALGQTRIIQDISKDWRFNRSDVAGAESRDYQWDSKWDKVDLPHTWNTKDVFDAEPGYHRGIGWYRRSFDVPQGWAGRRVVLRFEAACMVAMVWVNGQLLGEHKGAWTPFEYDITDLIEPGSKDNLIAVRVDNRRRRDVPPHDMDFNFMGGLHREVYLIAKDPVNIVSVQTTTPEVSETKGVVQSVVDVRNQGNKAKQIEVIGVLGGPGMLGPIKSTSPMVALGPGQAKKIKITMRPVDRPRLWSPDAPNLYKMAYWLRVDGKIVDTHEHALGFRWFRFDPAKGFFLNGKHLKLRGVNRHDDFPGLGWAIPKSRQTADLELIKDLGANFVRTAHYAQHPFVLETCDRLGLLVWEEVPFDGEGKQQMPFHGAVDYAQTLKHNLRETLLRDRNHPCIILWGLGNENLGRGWSTAEFNAVVSITKSLKKIVREMDPTRSTVVAIDQVSKGEKSGLVNVPDVVAYNLYFGWYKGVFKDFEKEVDHFREKHPNKSLIISEYGVGSERGRHTTMPSRQDFSEEYACMFHEFYWNVIAKRPFVAGSLVWNVFDFAVERRVKKQSIPHMNQKGLFTYRRVPKDVAYFYRSQWSKKPMVYIVSHTWTERDKGVTPIRVYSNGQDVELFLNNKSLGTKRRGETFVWDVPLAAGTNNLRAVARFDDQQVVDKLRINCE